MREAYILFIVLMTIVIGLMIYKFFIKKKPQQPPPDSPAFPPNNIAKKRKSILIKWDCSGSQGSPDWPNKPRVIRPAGSVDMSNPLTMISPTSNDDNSIVFDQTGGTVFTLSLKSITYFYKTDDTGTPVNIFFYQNPKSDTPTKIPLVTPKLVPNSLSYVDLSATVNTINVLTNDSFYPVFYNGNYDDGSFVVLEVELGGVPPIPASIFPDLKPYVPSSNMLKPNEYMTYGQTLTSPDGGTQFTLQNGNLNMVLIGAGGATTSIQSQIDNVAYLINYQGPYGGQLVFEDINLKWLTDPNLPFPKSGAVTGSTFQYNDKTQAFTVMTPATGSSPPVPIGTLSFAES